ncbi:MAG: TOMM precursor leader peptide-binding protein [Roseivirga sp.]
MNTINYTLNWHPRFRVEDPGLESLVFLGEQKQFLVPRAEYESINEVVAKAGYLSDYIFQSPDMLSSVRALEKIDRLVEDGIMADEAPSSYQTPDFDKPYGQVYYEGRKAYVLSQLISDGTSVSLLEGSALPPHFTLVLVDDYLDPRLLTLADQLKADGKTWLLCQLTGEMPMIGPLFGNAPDKPCYHCLRSHLIRNKPVREWHRRQSGLAHHTAVPVLNSQASQQKAIDLFRSQYLSMDSADCQDTLLVLDGVEPEGSLHKLIPQMLCKACGTTLRTLSQTPFRLANVALDADEDGGFRSVSRQKTISQLQDLINPVAGLLADFKEISESEDDELAIYQAAYFQNSFFADGISADTFVQLSLGKGVSKEQAMTSALGEAFERQAAQYTGDEEVIFSTADQLPHRTFKPGELSPFSPEQYKGFSAYSRASLQNPQWVKPLPENQPIHWTKGWSLSQEEFVYFPFAHCFANSPYQDHCHSLYTHNGNAAGNTREEALLQGLLELIERDTTAIWWYNQIPRPEISKDIVPAKNRAMIEKTIAEEWNYWLLDISADIHVVSCVAVGCHKKTGRFVMGFGSHLDVGIATQRALTEMYQLIVIKDKVTGPFDFDAIPPHPFLFPAKKLAKKELSDYPAVPRDICSSITHVMTELKAVGLELCVVDYSRPDIPLKTLKVIVPGLCHFWPQLAAKRLYEVPVNMGWLSAPLQEDELNPMALYL